MQREIIDSVLAGNDTLGLMPTGGGKSITFQVPALALDGVCVVITPLIALMKDQVHNLKKKGIRAEAIYSGMAHDDILRIMENAVFGAVKLLYISPERLSSETFRKKLLHIKVSFVCVDEAHCISQWGYDFRPAYLNIADLWKEQPRVPVLALTATATPAVVGDITDKLARGRDGADSANEADNADGFHGFRVFRMSFLRENLSYVVRETFDKEEQLIHILRSVEGAAIVYARSRQRTKDIAQMLEGNGIQATYFHAGLNNATKDQRQLQWLQDKTRVIVATNAFGMGIDKPDVRLVIHIDCPDSIEAYFQEAGRAGRDGKRAYAVLLYNTADKGKLKKRISDTYPEKDYIRKVYDHLAYFYQIAVGSGYNAVFEFPIDKFCLTYGHFPIRVESALKILNRAGYIEYREEEESRARVMFTVERDELYRLKGNSADEDNVIVALLRNYSGLFSEYNYIDEAAIAAQTGMTVMGVYMSLKALSHKHILSFIPQKRTPYVRYMQRREDSENLIFPPAVYEDLKQRFAERIQHIIDYASNGDICRSRQLLRYFGETESHDCGQCDVCLKKDDHLYTEEQVAEAQSMILRLLDDGKECHISALHNIPLPYYVIEEALERLLDEERIIDDDGILSSPAS